MRKLRERESKREKLNKKLNKKFSIPCFRNRSTLWMVRDQLERNLSALRKCEGKGDFFSVSLLCVSLVLPDGVACGHRGCLCHLSHPCEGCGRVGGRSRKPFSLSRSVKICRSCKYRDDDRGCIASIELGTCARKR